MKNLKIKIAAVIILLLAPFFQVLAQVGINPAEEVPVPVLCSTTGVTGIIGIILGVCVRPFGPAGGRTATDLVLGIIEIALAIAGMMAVLFVIVGGIRYITAHGNEEQAEAAKKTLTHAIVGIVIIILAFVIIRVISNALIKGSPGT